MIYPLTQKQDTHPVRRLEQQVIHSLWLQIARRVLLHEKRVTSCKISRWSHTFPSDGALRPFHGTRVSVNIVGHK